MFLQSIPLFLVLSVFVSAPGALSQDISGLPPCATTCLVTAYNAINKQCAQSDFTCLCKNTGFTSASSSCYASSCSVTDLASASAWSVKTCAAVGVSIAAHAINSTLTGGNNQTNTTSGTTNTAPINSTSPSTNANSAANSIVSLTDATKFLAIGATLALSFFSV